MFVRICSYLLVGTCSHFWVAVMVAAEEKQPDLARQLAPLIENHRGQVAVSVKHLETGEAFEHRADAPMPTASLIKFPLMVAAYQAIDEKRCAQSDVVELQEEDKVPGSGILTDNFSPGTQISLHDAIQLMIVHSDNTATNLVINRVGLDRTASLMTSLGLENTKLHSKVFRRDTSIFPERSKQFGLGSTTAGEMVALLAQLHERKLVSADASEKMLTHLKACNDRSKLCRHLPTNVDVAHKSGAVSTARTDAGIIFSPAGPIAVCILTAENVDHSWGDENEGELLCAEIGLAAFQHFNPDGAPSEPTIARVLKLGSNGPLVMALQRTLNARLKPSPELGVDGDFGPMTEGAVVRFQTEHNLPDNGEVGPDFWRALGPLVSEDEAVPDPEVANRATLERKPRDELTGIPFVTARAWAIMDGKTGELRWGQNEGVQRDPASTTKIMTAYVVTCLAENDPSVLDEIVTFSERADNTSGSTAGVKVGEQLSVHDLLFGLMLPSGNDASVALAEHFGERLMTGDAETDDHYTAFVAEMNRRAKLLELEQTHFKNTHGLTDSDHKTSAQDLARLAWHALKNPLFRETSAMQQYGCTLDSVAGYKRNVLWKNTNRLVGIEGYDGVKTGTTGAAGACLVARGARGEDQLIIVVLGSSSSDARYADVRNLFRWAWLELGHE